MTAKEKAEDLVKKHSKYAFKWEVKQAALITVDEILDLDSVDSVDKNYWEEVKKEIEKL